MKKTNEKKKRYDVLLAFVGHSDIEKLTHIKHAVENISGFDLIFFKTSSNPLIIVEGTTNINR